MISSQYPVLAGEQEMMPHLDSSQMHAGLGNFAGPQTSAAEQEADPRKLCILGLPWDTTDETLQNYFSQFGPLEEATIIRKARTGESRGFGFVTYRSNTDAQQVRLQEHSIGGRHCDAKQALPRGTANPSRETRLFVGRLPPSVTDAELKEHFERFGKVQDAYIPKDPATAKQAHRGFGFVTFANADDVDKVLSCAHSIGDQEIAVQCAIPKEKGPELIQSRGMSKWGVPNLPSDSYPSSADSLTTIPVPGQPFYPAASNLQGGVPQGMLGNPLDYGSVDPSAMDASLSRPYWSSGLHNSGATSTSGRGGQAPMQTGSSSGSLDRAHFDRLQFGTGSTPSQGGSRRSSVDFNVQRLGSNDSSMATEQSTIQALQGLTFGGSNEGIGIGLALLQARNRAANQAQAQANQTDPISRQAFPPLHQQARAQRQMHPTQLPAARSNLNGAAPRFVGQRLMPQPYLGGAQAYPSNLYPTPSGGIYGQPSGPYGVPAATPSFGGHAASHGGNVGPGEASAGPRMFVGKLNKETSEGDIKEYMTQFGYVLDVYMPRDKVKRNEHRGFGFVTFETPAAVQRVAQSGPHRIKGAVIVVDEAAPRREELPETEDGVEVPTTPSVPQAQFMNVISPPGSRLGTAGVGGSASESSYGGHGITSPGSMSHHGTSPTLANSFPADAGGPGMKYDAGGQFLPHGFGQQHTTVRTPLMDTANNGLGPVRAPSMDANIKGGNFVQY